MQRSRLNWANVLRGLAALAVALGAHMIGAVWTGPAIVANMVGLGPEFATLGPTPLWVELVKAVDWGAAGVAAFFLISGLVVPRSMALLNRRGILVSRSLRIFPTYAVGYLIGCAVVIVNHSVTESGASYSWDQVLVGMVPGLGDLVGIRTVPNIGWTLVIELAFYALVVVLYRRLLTSWWTGLAVAAACVVIFETITNPTVVQATPPWLEGAAGLARLITPYMPVIMIGVALTASQVKVWPRWRLPLVVSLLTAAYLYLIFQPGIGIFGMSLKHRLTYVVVIAGFVLVWKYSPDWKPGGIGGFFAEISYSLYVTHLILGMTLVLVGLQLGLPAFLATVVALAVVIAVSWVLHRTVERPTHQLGRTWARKVSSDLLTTIPTQPPSDLKFRGGG